LFAQTVILICIEYIEISKRETLKKEGQRR